MGLPPIVTFLFLLSLLVFIHELGHYLVAKAFNVKVLKFSIGFGPKIVGFRRGETEYLISALPLGGYVKMLGEDPRENLDPADRGRSFAEQTGYKRMLIAFAGPAMNLIFPVFIYFGVVAFQTTEMAADLGQVFPGMPAAEAGLLAGDRVTAVDGQPVYGWSDMQRIVSPKAGHKMDVTVDRAGQVLTVPVTAVGVEETDPLETQTVGKIGVSPAPVLSYIGLSKKGALHSAGLRSLDRVQRIDGQTITTQAEALRVLNQKLSQKVPFSIDVTRDDRFQFAQIDLFLPEPVSIKVTDTDLALAQPNEAEETHAYVSLVAPGTAAYGAGLRRGDKVISMDGKPVGSFAKVAEILREKKAQPFEIAFVRAGELTTQAVAQTADKQMDEISGREIERYRFGAYSGFPVAQPERVEVPFRPMLALRVATEATYEVGRKILLGIGMIFSGDIAFKNVGGPLQIFDITRQAAEAGLDTFLHTMALISLNLGLINLFPVPALDGGHIVQAGIEMIRRKPLSLRAREITNLVGLVMLLTLMAFVIKNDIVRYVLSN